MGAANGKLSEKKVKKLSAKTGYSSDEIVTWYSGFLSDCPSGKLTKKEFSKVYSGFFPHGDSRAFSEFIFAAFDRNGDGSIEFAEFLEALAITSKGSFQQKLECKFIKLKNINFGTAGNHAQALAYHGRDLGIPVTVCMPKIAPLVKVESCREMGAEVILHGDSFDETRDHAMKISAERDLTYINGFDHPDVIAGQGSVGVEILDDVPDVEYIVVPVGGGGLIAGIAKAVKHLKPDVKIIGVESERCPSWQTRQMLGKHTKCVWSQWGAKNTIADGLAVAEVGCNAYATCNDLLEKVISISEDWISIAILRLLEKEKAVTEGGGAAGVAAIIANALPELRGKKVCTVLCGGNIDASTLTRVIDRGLTAEGRIMRFTVNVQDRPGGMVEMLKIVSDCGASVKEVQHDRMLLTAFVYKVALIATVETRGRENAQQLMKAIKDRYEDAVTFHTISACHYGEPTAAMLSQSADPTQETVSEEDLLVPSSQ
ncbi:unnamed protein product [Oikopleura dioica]|uniref:L-serine deaminase n=1 Tax=Oikopleura dioica TaxID=34765 RepID=E4Y785_OIKDI|nr:unnamed protein product [Oikopleura dioica]